MQSSKPRSATTWRHFSGPPAMPMARQPLMRRDLADGAADRAGRRRHDHRLAGLDVRDLHQADHGRGARLADDAEAERERLQVGRQLAQAPAVEGDMLAPAELALHGVTDPEVRMAALDHHAGAAADHHVAGLQGIGVLAVPAAHLPAHVGIDRQEMRARQDLAVGRLRDGRLDQAKAAGIGHAVGRPHEDDLAMCRHGATAPRLVCNRST